MYYRARYYHPALGRFISADTLVPSPSDPQSLNRYSYVLNNPLKYTDPSGHFTRDEIVEYSGAADWGEALSFFEEGGKWEGRWGWLAVLNRALLGDSIKVLTGMPSFWAAPGSPETLFSGRFTEMDGQLYLSPQNGRMVPFGFAGSWGEAYLTIGNNPRGWGTGYIGAYSHSYVGFDLSRVDWSGIAFDGLGVLVDCAVPGSGAIINFFQASYKGVDIMKFADGIVAGKGAYEAAKEASIDFRETLDVGLSVSGILIPIWADVASIYYNFGQGFYSVPIQEVAHGEEYAPRLGP